METGVCLLDLLGVEACEEGELNNLEREKAVEASKGSGSQKRIPDKAGLDLHDTASSPMKPPKEGETCQGKTIAQR